MRAGSPIPLIFRLFSLPACTPPSVLQDVEADEAEKGMLAQKQAYDDTVVDLLASGFQWEEKDLVETRFRYGELTVRGPKKQLVLRYAARCPCGATRKLSVDPRVLRPVCVCPSSGVARQKGRGSPCEVLPCW